MKFRRLRLPTCPETSSQEKGMKRPSRRSVRLPICEISKMDFVRLDESNRSRVVLRSERLSVRPRRSLVGLSLESQVGRKQRVVCFHWLSIAPSLKRPHSSSESVRMEASKFHLRQTDPLANGLIRHLHSRIYRLDDEGFLSPLPTPRPFSTFVVFVFSPSPL